MDVERDTITGLVKISGELDIETAEMLREALWNSFSSEAAVAVDLSSAISIDAAALQVLLACEKTAVSSDKGFRLLAVPQELRDMAEAIGFSLGELSTGKDLDHAA